MANTDAKKQKVAAQPAGTRAEMKELSPCRLAIEFEVPVEMVARETELVFDEVQKNSRLDGFRQGKAPAELVKQRFSGAVREKVIENLIHDSVFPFLKEKKIIPVDPPSIEKMEFEQGKPMKFTVALEQHPHVHSKNYKDIRVKKQVKKVTDKDTDNAIADVQKYNSQLVESAAEAVTKEHFVVANYEVILDGKELPELRGDNQLINLSSDYILPGLTEGLVGAKKNDEKEISSRIPDSYAKKDLAGKPVQLKIKVLAIKERQLPKADDSLAKDMGYADFAEMKRKVAEMLQHNNEHEADDKLEEELRDQLLKNNDIPVLPESMLKSQVEYLSASFMQKLMYQGIPKDTAEKKKEENLPKIREEAEKQLKLMYIFDSIAEQEKISVTEKDLADEKEKQLKAYPDREKMINKQFSDRDELARAASRIRTEKIFRFVLEKSKVKTEYI